MSNELWQKAAQIIVDAGQYPMLMSDTMIELAEIILTKEQAEFIKIFKKPLNFDEIKEITGQEESSLRQMLDELLYAGIIIAMPGKSSGIVVYRLQGPIPGLIEYLLMRGENTEKEKKLAVLFDRMYQDLCDNFQSNYDTYVEMFQKVKPLNRIIPINSEINETGDHILPYEDLDQIIEKFDTIATGRCYCRQEKKLLGKECTRTSEDIGCLYFGRTARFVIDYNFGREITRDEARKILKKAAEDGLVHAAFHEKQDVEKDEYVICNCCPCCCATFELFRKGGSPKHVFSSYLARINPEDCTQCEACVSACPMEAIRLDDEIIINQDHCIGCGVCASRCPTGAITLERFGNREVFIAPEKVASN